MDALANEGVKPAYVEGYDRSEWILLDYFGLHRPRLGPDARLLQLERCGATPSASRSPRAARRHIARGEP